MTSTYTPAQLVDRAEISDLENKFAYYLDSKQWQNWLELFADDGVLELPGNPKTKQTLLADGGPKGLMTLHATHHISSNHQIEIDGDTASCNSYVQAVHVIDPDRPDTRWTVGGWYDKQYRRTAAGWKVVRARLTTVWTDGVFPGFGGADAPRS